MLKGMWTAALVGSVVSAAAWGRQGAVQPSKGMGEGDQIILNFDKDVAGKLPEGWKAASGLPGGAAPLWKVAADPTAPSSPNVLELTAAEHGTDGFNLCYCQQHSFKDVDVTARVHPIGGKTSQGGGVAFRIENPETFYSFTIDPQEGKCYLYKVMSGKSTELHAANFTGSGPGASTWYTVRAQMLGDEITCWVDGKRVVSAKDDSIKEAGHIGLATRNDATASFDDLKAMKVMGGEKEAPAPKGKPELPPKGEK